MFRKERKRPLIVFLLFLAMSSPFGLTDCAPVPSTEPPSDGALTDTPNPREKQDEGTPEPPTVSPQDAATFPEAPRERELVPEPLHTLDVAPDQDPPEPNSTERREQKPEQPPETAPKRVPLLVGFGHGHRTVVSCDDGKSWVHNAYRYYKGPSDAFSHSEWTSKGIAYAKGGFVTAMGWGAPARLSHSLDGASWKHTFDPQDPNNPHYKETGGHWTIAASDQVVIAAGGRQIRRSLDGGKSWEAPRFVHKRQAADAVSHGNIGTGKHKGVTHWIIYGDNNKKKDAQGNSLYTMYYSADEGQTWSLSQTPKEFTFCAAGGRWAFGDGKFMLASSSTAKASVGRPGGAVCTSSDGGKTWEYAGPLGVGTRHLLWTGTHFRSYTTGAVFESKEGKTWTKGSLTGIELKHTKILVRVPSTGTYIAFSNKTSQSTDHIRSMTGWFLRSPDGLTWSLLPESAYPPAGRGGALVGIAAGIGNAPPQCQP